MNIQLLIIDPQNDFCWPGFNFSPFSKTEQDLLKGVLPVELINPGALYVPGAENDMSRLATMIIRLKDKLDDIHVTLDSHHLVDIAHPIFWIDSKGHHPNPFTIITVDDVFNGVWRTTNPAFQNRKSMEAALADPSKARDGAEEYVLALKNNKRYDLCIWPPHCLIGTPGGSVFPELYQALSLWENDLAMVNYVTKGSNIWTEHYSAVQADVPDPEDPGTQLNWGLIETLQKADLLLLAGEASTHCKINTVLDIANNFGEDNIKKMVWLKDSSSPVPNPPGMTLFSDFLDVSLKDLTSRGMQFSTTVDFLK